MSLHADKSQENKDKAQTNASAYHSNRPLLQFVDNRSENIQQKNLQSIISRGTLIQPQTQLKSIIQNGNDQPYPGTEVIQRKVKIEKGLGAGEYTTKNGKDTNGLVDYIKQHHDSELNRGWIGALREKAYDHSTTHTFQTVDDLVTALKALFPAATSGSSGAGRPGFPASSAHLGRMGLALLTEEDQADFKPGEEDAALPHRFPYKAIEVSTMLFADHTENVATFIRWTDRILNATKARAVLSDKIMKEQSYSLADQALYHRRVKEQIAHFEASRSALADAVNKSPTPVARESAEVVNFIYWCNAMHGNIPDYGPHSSINARVQDHIHLHIVSGRLTPGSEAAARMSPHRSKGVAYSSDGEELVTTTGELVKFTDVAPDHQKLIRPHPVKQTHINQSAVPDFLK